MRYFALVACAFVGCLPGLDGGGSGGGGGGSGGSSPGSADAHQQHNLDTLNRYRAQAGVAALVIDDRLNAFSTTAAMQLEATGQPHGYFMQQGSAIWQAGFCASAAENQAPGWPVNGDEDGTIDAILQAMMNEGPGGGHHDNILAASSTRVGIGLVVDAQGRLWLSNDFSGPCR